MHNSKESTFNNIESVLASTHEKNIARLRARIKDSHATHYLEEYLVGELIKAEKLGKIPDDISGLLIDHEGSGNPEKRVGIFDSDARIALETEAQFLMHIAPSLIYREAVGDPSAVSWYEWAQHLGSQVSQQAKVLE